MTPSALRERLLQHAQQRADTYGCEHTSIYDEWCPQCKELLIADLRDAASLLASLETQQAALRALVDKLDAVHADPRYEAVWVSYHVHGGRYDEPKYDVELAAAKAALSPSPSEDRGTTEARSVAKEAAERVRKELVRTWCFTASTKELDELLEREILSAIESIAQHVAGTIRRRSGRLSAIRLEHRGERL